MSWAGEEGEVLRPALPLLLFPLGGLLLGLFCAEYLAWNGATMHPAAILALGLLAVASGLFCICRIRGPAALRSLVSLGTALALGLTVGLLFWMLAANRAHEAAEALGERSSTPHSLVILEDAKQGAISKTSLATLEVADVGTVKVRIFWDGQQEPLPLGARLEAHVVFKPLSETQAFLHQKGVFGSVTLEDITVEGFSATPLGAVYAFREHNRGLLATFAGEGSVLLRGVLLGDTTELDSSEAGRDFKVTGLSHLVAVSGSHLVVIALLISWLIRRLGLRRSVEVAIITALLVSYVFLTGLQPSAIRACVMTFIASMATFVGRRGHIPSALAAAAFGMLLLYPPTAFSVGFWLSVFAVFGLTIFCPLITRYFGCLLPSPEELPVVGERRWLRVLRGIRRALLDPFSLTVTAQMATLPITAPLFATVSLVSPLANLLVTPFITLLVGGGIAALCLMPLLGPLGPFLLGCLCGIADVSILVAAWCARLPFACLAISLDLTVAVVCALLIAAALYRLWPQPSRKRCLLGIMSFALSGLLLFATTFLPASPQVVMFDVGQGDAILIREGRSNILIDTGPSDSALLRSLARQRVSHLDAVIVTHLDEDHCGALDALSGTIAVDHVFFAAGLPEARAEDEPMRVARMLLKGGEPEELARGDTLTLGARLELVMLWPDREVAQGDNEESLCLGLSYDSDHDGAAEFRMLLTGDAEAPQLAGLLAKGVPVKSVVDAAAVAGMADATGATGATGATEIDLRFDILKIGHHGSSGAVTTAQLERMGCRLALISVGENNRYGHPTPETLSELDRAGVAVYRTDFNGEIALHFETERVVVRCDTMTVEN